MDSEENATSCSVCREIYSDPRCLACGHSFCLTCLKGVAGNKQKFPCPICRFDVDLGYTNIDQLPKNFVLCNVIEALDNKYASMCSHHNKSLDLFCQGCDVVICSKCLTMQHKGHSIEDIEIIFIKRNKQYGAFLENTKHLVLMTAEKTDTVKQLRISMEKNIDSISKTVENTFKKWNDALQKQHNAILSYIRQERDQKRQVFFEAERILEGSMTTLTGLDNEISKLRSKDTAYVVQQYGSIKARQEDTERKVLQDIETCFTPTDNLVLEVYAPWIEEAINNIKHIDMKQTQARSGRQKIKIAEIQEENFILKRECRKLRITLQELEKSSEQLRAEHHNLKTVNTTLYESYEDANSLSNGKKGTKELQKTYNRLEQDLEREFNQKKKEWEKYCKQLTKKHTNETEQLHKIINSLTVEKDTLLTRLSKIASDRFTNDNVNIADLSDADRPTKLQEQYSELYDNEWTDAFEELITHDNITEDDAIMILLKILMSCFHNCREITWGRYERLKNVASSVYIEEEVSMPPPKENVATGDTNVSEASTDKSENKKGKNFAKKNEASDDESVREASKDKFENKNGKNGANKIEAPDDRSVREAPKDKFDNKKGKHLLCTLDLNFDLMHDIMSIWRKTTLELKRIAAEPLYSVIERCLDMPFIGQPMISKYLKSCIDLCWKMGVQQRPLHLDGFAEMDAYAGKKFDKDKFRPYRISGRHVAFFVWPTLYLYEGGPILVKGIVQCCSSVEAKNEEPS